jgi:hypothetical protein
MFRAIKEGVKSFQRNKDNEKKTKNKNLLHFIESNLTGFYETNYKMKPGEIEAKILDYFKDEPKVFDYRVAEEIYEVLYKNRDHLVSYSDASQEDRFTDFTPEKQKDFLTLAFPDFVPEKLLGRSMQDFEIYLRRRMNQPLNRIKSRLRK